MRTHALTDRWPRVAMMVILLLALGFVATAPALGQGVKEADDDEATEEATEQPLDRDTEEATEEPFDPAEQEEDWEEAGLVDDRSYESPQFGYTVDWSRNWSLDLYYDQPDEDIQPVMSDEEIEQDLLYLIWTDNGEEAYAIISGQTANRGGPEGDVDEWTDPDYVEDEEIWGPGAEVEVLLDDTTRDSGAVLYSIVDTENDDAQYYTIYQSIELEDGATLYLTLQSTEDWLEGAYESWTSDVEIDGAPIEVVFEWEDIEAAL